MECAYKAVYCENKETAIRYERDLMIVCLTDKEISLLVDALKDRTSSLDLSLDERALLCNMTIRLGDAEVDIINNNDPDEYVAEYIKKALRD